MKMDSILISVIVPVYNVEKYLNQCVDSILNQTYKNFELILVDDGSPDNCPAICDEYAKLDARVKVIHKENGGSSSAREVGLSNSLGSYFMFVDGDDWIDAETLFVTVNKAKETNADCVMFSYVKEYERNSIPVYIYNNDLLTENREEAMAIYHRFFGLVKEELSRPELADSIVSCCMKLYKKEVSLQSRFFDTKEVGSCEDGLFNIYSLRHSYRLYYLNATYYHYRKTNSTSLTSAYKPLFELWDNLFAAMRKAIDELRLPAICIEALDNRIALSIIGIGFCEINNPNKKSAKQNLKKWLLSPQYQTSIKKLNFKYLPLKWRVFLWFCKKGNSRIVYLFLKIMNRMRKKYK